MRTRCHVTMQCMLVSSCVFLMIQTYSTDGACTLDRRQGESTLSLVLQADRCFQCFKDFAQVGPLEGQGKVSFLFCFF